MANTRKVFRTSDSSAGRRAIMPYKGICRACDGPSESTSRPHFRSTKLANGKRIETCRACDSRYRRYGDFNYTPPRGKHTELIPKIVKLRQAGVGVSEISRRVGMARGLVYHHLRKYNLHLLSRNRDARKADAGADRRSRAARPRPQLARA